MANVREHLYIYRFSESIHFPNDYAGRTYARRNSLDSYK